MIVITNAQQYNLLIGTYTNKGNSEGIYVYNFNAKTGESKLINSVKTTNPSFLTVSKDKKFVYSVNETGKNSEVSSFNFNTLNGELAFLNKQFTNGENPCYILNDEKNVISANYSGGSISVFGRNADGSLTSVKQIVQHTGKSIDPLKRQLSAHVHQVQFSPDKKYVISTDLGEDQIYIYRYNPTSNAQILTLHQVVKTNAGTGPRHLVFSKNGKFAYLAHEFNGSITVFNYTDGDLTKLQEIGTVEKEYKGKIDGADIHLSADGKFLYETNRGDLNTISLFAITKDGRLTFIETISTLGKGPRNFTIDPTGKFLLVAHQYTNDVVIFNRNANTGKLTDSGKRINVGVPVCLLFSN
jgi:6-phosphogluconolactonase